MKGARNEQTAMRLAVAIKRLRTRLQEAALSDPAIPPISQLALIHRLRAGGPATAASLALAEHVSPQAIAQNLTALKRAGLVRTAPDPTDGRKSLVRVTSAGDRLFESAIASRNAWLARTLDAALRPGESAVLDQAIALLERIAGHADSGEVPVPNRE